MWLEPRLWLADRHHRNFLLHLLVRNIQATGRCDHWSYLGIFVAKGDVGVGTIVGSAVFNIVCVIGICGLFVNEVGFILHLMINQ